MTDLIADAWRFATETHQRINQRRTFTNPPDQEHLEAAAELVARVTGDADLIAAAWSRRQLALRLAASVVTLIALMSLSATTTARAETTPVQAPGRISQPERSEPVVQEFAVSSVDCALDDARRPETLADHQSFSDWLAHFRHQATRCGIAPTTLSIAFDGVRPIDELLAFDRRQAEYTNTFAGYLAGRVSDGMVADGRERIERQRDLLARLQQRHGVPPQVLVALWGLESGYGANIGNTEVIDALVTLAYDGRRRHLYEQELLNALRMLDRGLVERRQMIGSWAGAMGQTQFMPSTFIAHARDGDDDGRADLWTSSADALTSAADYLASIGWRRGEPWGREVVLPAHFDPYQARLSLRRTGREWSGLGVRTPDGDDIPEGDLPGSIILPAGREGPAFLVFDNFHAILEWNRSLFYALSVGHLADRLAGAGPLVRMGPEGLRLRTSDIVQAQHALNALGFETGGVDGMVGMQTRQAIRDFQRSRGLAADAYPDLDLISALVEETGGDPTRRAHSEQLDEQGIRTLQRALDALGYKPGPIDGLMGRQTRIALSDYLRDRGLTPNSEPTSVSVARAVEEAQAE